MIRRCFALALVLLTVSPVTAPFSTVEFARMLAADPARPAASRRVPPLREQSASNASRTDVAVLATSTARSRLLVFAVLYSSSIPRPADAATRCRLLRTRAAFAQRPPPPVLRV